MNRVGVSRSASDALRILVLFFALMATVIAPQALAQQSDAPSGDNASEVLPLTQLADLLENDESRAQIVDQLRQAAQAGEGENADSPLPPPPDSAEDPALAKAPDHWYWMKFR